MDTAPTNDESGNPALCQPPTRTLTGFERYAVLNSYEGATMRPESDAERCKGLTRQQEDNMITQLLQRNSLSVYVNETTTWIANMKARILEEMQPNSDDEEVQVSEVLSSIDALRSDRYFCQDITTLETEDCFVYGDYLIDCLY
jgi:hypothetical protein